MTFIVRMLKYLFWLLVVSWSFALLRKLVGQMATGAPRSGTPMDVPNDAMTQQLVRDPVCGMHIAEGLALPLRHGGETLFFCSADCRDKYLSETRKFAANE
jgi:YHS domain-containing protein